MNLETKLANELAFYKKHYALNDNEEVVIKRNNQKPPTSIDRDGYKKVGTKLYHRIVFGLYYDGLPEFLDHADRDKTNNHPINLRPATVAQNSANRATTSPTTGFKGVRLEHRSKVNPYVAHHAAIGNIYPSATAMEAAIAYDIHAYAIHGEYACLNADMGLYGEISATAKRMIIEAFETPEFIEMALFYKRQREEKERAAANLPNTIGVNDHEKSHASE